MNKLRAVANPIRVKLILCLGKKPKNVSELIKVCNLSQSAVSQHLSILKKADIVVSQKEGKEIYYHLKDVQAGKLGRHIERYINS